VAERERLNTRQRGTVFVPKSQLLSPEEVQRAVRRMAHEILERNEDIANLVIIGLQTGGICFAERLADVIHEVSGVDIETGTLDVAFYRDDVTIRPVLESAETSVDADLADRVVLLVDDVLYTGRTIRAALNALADWGRPQAIQLAVMVDRGHRELPIRPDFVGKNLPTRRHELVNVTMGGVELGELQKS
jgi:pyrimidine operon attenuation protein/uracil phosphoribosyltransferase